LKTGGLRQEEREEAQGLSCEESNERNGCQHVDRASFRMEIDFPRKGVGIRMGRANATRVRRNPKRSYRGRSYELRVEEPSKLHLTTRMVTSSLKLSPQKSAALS